MSGFWFLDFFPWILDIWVWAQILLPSIFVDYMSIVWVSVVGMFHCLCYSFSYPLASHFVLITEHLPGFLDQCYIISDLVWCQPALIFLFTSSDCFALYLHLSKFSASIFVCFTCYKDFTSLLYCFHWICFGDSHAHINLLTYQINKSI